MAFVNYNNKEITVKIVYYGPALSGKTTCLQYVYESGKYKKKGKLITLDTDGDRTLFFDFLPIEIGKLGDYSIKMQLYTVPGQVAYNTTRKLVLQGSDGIVFVSDSQVVMRDQNIDSFSNLKENLKANNISFSEMPLIFQFNKRDLKEILPIDILNGDLNPENKAFFPTIGTTGENVLEGLHAIMKMTIIHLRNKLSIFQKDKTVMFSRDEVTDSVSKEEKGKKKKKGETPPPVNPVEAPATTNIRERSDVFGSEDTEKEDIFELSSPMGDEPLKTNAYPKEEDIFNLEDESRFDENASESDEYDIPEDVLHDELGSSDKKPRAGQKEKSDAVKVPVSITGTEDEYDSAEVIGKEYELKSDDIIAGAAEVPIRIDIPQDKDEVTINLNLRIIIKKKP
jgi:signal recognition particle receptor subunit beta